MHVFDGPDRVLQRPHRLLGIERPVADIGARLPGGDLRVVLLIEITSGEERDERFLPVGRAPPEVRPRISVKPGHGTRNRARVDTAAERSPHGDVASHSDADRVEEKPAELFHLVLVAAGDLREMIA